MSVDVSKIKVGDKITVEMTVSDAHSLRTTLEYSVWAKIDGCRGENLIYDAATRTNDT
jgi:hypothetical protein